jgi:hypothetical protein
MSDAHNQLPPAPDDTEHAASTRRVLQPPPASQPAPPEQPPSRPPARRPQDPGERRPSSSRRGYQPGVATPPPPYSAAVQQPYPPPRRAARRRSVPPSESPLYLPWWSLLVMVAVVGAAAFGLMFAFTQLSEPQVPGNQPPRVQLITAQPTLSEEFAAGGAQPAFWPTPIPQLYPSPTVPLPTPIPSPTLPPGEFGIGSEVQVVGVGSSGLNMRSEPGLEGTPRFLASEEDTFVIVDGPQTVDDLEWWRLEDPNDPSRYGWAARNYLMAVSP